MWSRGGHGEFLSLLASAVFNIHIVGREMSGIPTWLAGLLLEEGKRLGEYGIIAHHRPSTCASVVSTWGSQKVMSRARYISMAVARVARAGTGWPIFA